MGDSWDTRKADDDVCSPESRRSLFLRGMCPCCGLNELSEVMQETRGQSGYMCILHSELQGLGRIVAFCDMLWREVGKLSPQSRY